MNCEGIQACSQLTPAAADIAARLIPGMSQSIYDSMTGSWRHESNIYSNYDNIEFSAIAGRMVSKPVRDLLRLQSSFHGWIETKLAALVERVEKHLKGHSGYDYIHKAEHDRIILQFYRDLDELNENFEDMFKHDYDGKYLDDKEFKEEIREQYREEIGHKFIIEYEVLLDAEVLFQERMKQQSKAFNDDYERFKKAFEAQLTPEQKALIDEEEASLNW